MSIAASGSAARIRAARIGFPEGLASLSGAVQADKTAVSLAASVAMQPEAGLLGLAVQRAWPACLGAIRADKSAMSIAASDSEARIRAAQLRPEGLASLSGSCSSGQNSRVLSCVSGNAARSRVAGIGCPEGLAGLSGSHSSGTNQPCSYRGKPSGGVNPAAYCSGWPTVPYFAINQPFRMSFKSRSSFM